MPQWESVEEIRRVAPGAAGTLIPSWNTGFPLRAAPEPGASTGGVVRPGQKLHVLEERDGHLLVRQEAEGHEGWVPAHIVAPWPGA
ncbi:MAG: Bacterial dipeptidyl-peptidase Sh3 domain [Chloroflexota bacterium]|jgi:hypothetical protein|nr:Bacterial dipeptidyl-peptidase Sh3 domain [Chloroflexota bacterium]